MLKKINEIQAGVVIVPEGQELLEDRTYIIVKQNPRNLMPILLNYFKPKMQKIENQIEKIFRGYCINEAVFKILHLEYKIIPIIEEIERIHKLLEEDIKNGRFKNN